MQQHARRQGKVAPVRAHKGLRNLRKFNAPSRKGAEKHNTQQLFTIVPLPWCNWLVQLTLYMKELYTSHAVLIWTFSIPGVQFWVLAISTCPLLASPDWLKANGIDVSWYKHGSALVSVHVRGLTTRAMSQLQMGTQLRILPLVNARGGMSKSICTREIWILEQANLGLYQFMVLNASY